MSENEPATYAVLVYEDPQAWQAVADATTEQGHEAMYARDYEFGERLTGRGFRIVGGAELGDIRRTATVRGGPDGAVVTDGPFAETIEQLGGFYLVRADDRDELVRLAAILARPDEAAGLPGRVVEVRTAESGSDS